MRMVLFQTVELLSAKLEEPQKSKDAPDVIIFDMIHSQQSWRQKAALYNYFRVKYKPYCIDVSSAAVKTELAQAAGFRDKSHDGDQTYFRDISN